MSARQKQPQIIQMVAGISLNGKIADDTGSFEQYSSSEDQQWLQQKIAESDALVMGRKTYERHVKEKSHRPIILFTRSVQGLKASEDDRQLYRFNDTREEFLNLCNLLQFKTITVLGGAEVYHWCVEQKVLTDCFLTIEPHIIAGGKHLLEGGLITESESWKLKSRQQLNDQGSQLLHYSLI